MTDAHQYTIPKEPGLGRSLLFAALVHAALLAFLWIGVQWQSNHPATIEAEVWDPQPREAAPPPAPVKVPEPAPEPKPVIKEPPKPIVKEPPPVEKPDIALEQEKKRKAAEEKKRREEEERLAKEKKRLEEEKLAKLKQEEAKREKEKAEKEKAEKAKKEAAEKKRLQEEADARLADKIREENMRRIIGAGGSGDAPKAQGGRASVEWASKVGAKIKSHITFVVPEGLQGNPPVEYEVRLLPDGSVAGMRKLRSSGVPGFDEAVARAIERAQPFPRDSNGSMPSSFTGTHKPKD
ncbi:hypothetical protein GCM10027343_30550 [Noviherbaspirillum agri]